MSQHSKLKKVFVITLAGDYVKNDEVVLPGRPKELDSIGSPTLTGLIQEPVLNLNSRQIVEDNLKAEQEE